MAKKIQSSTAGIRTEVLPESPELRRDRAPAEPSGLTVGGVAIEELAGGHLIPYGNTDQGIEERMSRPHATAHVTRSEPPKPVVKGGSFDKNREARAASRLGMEMFDAPDPLKELAEAHVKPGFRAKFLSPAKVARQGTRGFEVIKVDGEPITLGAMVLAQIPEERAIARNQTFQEQGAAKLRAAKEEHQEQINQLERDAGVRRPGAGRAGRPDPAGGLQETRGSSVLA